VRAAPSGETILAGGVTGHVFAIDLPAARNRATISLHAWGNGAAFLDRGSQWLIADSKDQLLLFSAANPASPPQRADGAKFIQALAVAPDEQTAVTVAPPIYGDRYGTLHVWSLRPLRHASSTTAPAGLICAAYSPNGKLLATGDDAGKLRFWETDTWRNVRTIPASAAQLRTVVFTPDGHQILTGGDDKTVRQWDSSSGAPLLQLPPERGAIREICISRDGRLAAIALSDETARCWNLDDGREIALFSRHRGGVEAVDFLPDASALITGGDNGGVAVWPLQSDEAPTFRVHDQRVSAVCLLPDGLTALSASWDRHIHRFDLATGRVLQTVTAPEQVWCLALAPDGRAALVGGAAGMLQVLNVSDFTLSPVKPEDLGQVEFPPDSGLTPQTQPATGPYTRPIATVAISPSANAAAVGGYVRTYGLLQWPPRPGALRRVTHGRVLAAAFTPLGDRVIVSDNAELKFIDVSSRQIVRQINNGALVTALAVSPDGRTIASGGSDGSINLFESEVSATPKGSMQHLAPVRGIVFFPEGRSLASVGDDDAIRLWDLDRFHEIRTFNAQSHVQSLALSRDGTLLLSAGEDGSIRKWDLSRPQRYRELESRLGRVCARLDANQNDAAALRELGEWYAFRNRNDWAIDCLERARAGGEHVSPLMLARCYWMLDRPDDASREFAASEVAGEAPADYLHLCITRLRQR
jgi:WD40 repeat protein